MSRLNFFVSILVVILSLEVFAAPSSLTYQGRILKSDGTPLEYSAVAFIFQITDPLGQCVIYQEQVTGINMTNSGGIFDVPIGAGAVNFPLGGNFSVLDAFNNTSVYTCGSCTGYSCSNGTSTYVAAIADLRKLRVQFYDGGGWKTISPDSVIRSVPFAGYSLSAQKLGTNVASDFVLKTGVPTCGAGTFLSWNGTSLVCSGIGSASGDLSGSFPAPKVVALQNNPVDATTPTANQVLQWNGAKWAPATLSGGSSGTLVSVDTGAGLQGGPITSSGTISLTDVLAAPGTFGNSAQVPSFTVNAQGRVTNALAINIAIPWSAITSGKPTTLSGYGITDPVQSTSLASGNIWVGNGSGAAAPVLPGGDVTMTNAGVFSVTALRGKNISNTAPSTAGQILRYDGTSWTPNFLSMADLRSTITGTSVLASCSANQTLTWSAATDNLACSNISGLTGANFSSTSQNFIFAGPSTGGSGAPVFRALASSDLPSGVLSGVGTSGYLPVYNTSTTLTASPIFVASANIGIGTNTPSSLLEVAGGDAKINTLTIGMGNTSDGNNITSTALGLRALVSNVSGYSNTAVGANSLRNNNSGAFNTAMGQNALNNNYSGNYNTGFGYQALNNNSLGSQNTALGYGALQKATQSNNTALGFQALLANASGMNNTAVGSGALLASTTGGYNIGIGYNAGASLNTQSGVVIIGSNPGTSINDNEILIANGNGIERLRIDASGKIGIGTSSPSQLLHVNGSALADSWNLSSDIRLKTHIKDIEKPLAKILALRGVEFDWRSDVEQPTEHRQIHDIGVIAQEVEKQFPEAVHSEGEGYKSVSYSKLVAPLIGAIKEVYNKYLNQQMQIDQLKKENQEIKAHLEKLDKLLQKQASQTSKDLEP